MPASRLRRASPRGALFAFLWRLVAAAPLLLFPLCLPTLVQADACTAVAIAERAAVRYVYDGDTLILGDQRRVRLIGVDTPELGRDGRPDQPFALEARDALRRLLTEHHNRIQLRFDTVRQDRYGRLLAHLYLPDGGSVERWLLHQGLATAFIVPPNVANLACYREAEQEARRARRGLWALPRYQVRDSRELEDDARGFHIIRGRIGRIGEGRRNIWLNLPGRVALRIERDDLGFFPGLDVSGLQGRTVEARGWLQWRKGKLRMRIRHPAALTILDEDAAGRQAGGES